MLRALRNGRDWAGPLAFLLVMAGGLDAEDSPLATVHRMCADAVGIVAAERTGQTTVKVVEWILWPAGPTLPAGAELEIVGLDEHSRVIGPNRAAHPEARGGRTVLTSQRLVCFLEPKGVAWHALGTVGDGSAGLIWIEDGACYRYRPPGNLGGHRLAKDPAYESEAALRAAIATGLADRRGWEEAQEIRHPEEQAVVLVSYLLPRTSPEGEAGTYRSRVRQVLPKLGVTAVRELAELLRTARPEDQLDPAVLVLSDLGPEARPALPLLLPLLERPAQVDPAKVLEALGRIGDAAAAPGILYFLGHRELAVRAEAAKALAVFRYQDAAGDIAKSLPATVDERDAYHVYAMLSALRDLDRTRAATFTRKYIDRPEMAPVHNLLVPLLEE